MCNLDLLKKLNDFYIYANEGFYIDKVFNKNNYVITYSEKVTDFDCNYITNLVVKCKEEFNSINKTIKDEMSNLNRKVCYIISPVNDILYNNRKDFFDAHSFKEINNEVWQIFDDFDNVENMKKYGNLNVELVKANDMKKFAIINDECFSTGDKEDPYGSLDKGYIDIYENYKESANSKYKREIYFVKLHDEIVGVTVSVYGDGICGIYGLAIKKEYRKHGIGKEVLRQQIKICKDRNVDIVFLQTEEGFYPAETYRKFGFKDVCNVYYYIENL